MLGELAQLVLDMQDTTEEWLASRSAPVRSTYTVPGKTRHTQIPVVLHLLKMVGYPDVAGMTADLTDGFDMLGELRRGPGWKPRTDGRLQPDVARHTSVGELGIRQGPHVEAQDWRVH